MNIQPLHPNFQVPTRGTELAGGYDIYMPKGGALFPDMAYAQMVGLGFAAEVPPGYVALLLPRSGAGAKNGLELNNTCGVIDADYRGEWKAALRVKNAEPFQWKAGDRVLQYILVPVHTPELQVVETLSSTARGEGGFGSTNKV